MRVFIFSKIKEKRKFFLKIKQTGLVPDDKKMVIMENGKSHFFLIYSNLSEI